MSQNLTVSEFDQKSISRILQKVSQIQPQRQQFNSQLPVQQSQFTTAANYQMRSQFPQQQQQQQQQFQQQPQQQNSNYVNPYADQKLPEQQPKDNTYFISNKQINQNTSNPYANNSLPQPQQQQQQSQPSQYQQPPPQQNIPQPVQQQQQQQYQQPQTNNNDNSDLRARFLQLQQEALQKQSGIQQPGQQHQQGGNMQATVNSVKKICQDTISEMDYKNYQQAISNIQRALQMLETV